MSRLIEVLENGGRKNFARFVDDFNADNYIKGIDFANEVGDKYTPVYGFWLNTGGLYGTQSVIVTPEYLINGNSVADNNTNPVGVTGKLMAINADTELYNEFADYCNQCKVYLTAELATNNKGQQYSVLKLHILDNKPKELSKDWCKIEDFSEDKADPDLPF